MYVCMQTHLRLHLTQRLFVLLQARTVHYGTSINMSTKSLYLKVETTYLYIEKQKSNNYTITRDKFQNYFMCLNFVFVIYGLYASVIQPDYYFLFLSYVRNWERHKHIIMYALLSSIVNSSFHNIKNNEHTLFPNVVQVSSINYCTFRQQNLTSPIEINFPRWQIMICRTYQVLTNQ